MENRRKFKTKGMLKLQENLNALIVETRKATLEMIHFGYMMNWGYQVICWDGCGIWHVSDTITRTRRIARIVKTNYKIQSSVRLVSSRSMVSRLEIINSPKWKTVKIWDRKRKEFIY